MQVKCPTCGKTHSWSHENPFRPFCCERCRLIDLGKWADESHRIPGDDTAANDPQHDTHPFAGR